MDSTTFWSFGDKCIKCGKEGGFDYDVIEEDDSSLHDIVDCPNCNTRLFYED